jgi:predicted acetyltransferase
MEHRIDRVLVPAELQHLPLLANLFQLYVHDFSELVAVHVAEDGRFPVASLESYWQEAWRHPFLVRVDGHWAGFAFVHQRSRLTEDRETWDMAEFFVMRGFRRAGVGARAAVELFERFPGRWEVRERHANTAATAFWRKVIGRYTGGAMVETIHDSDRWKGPVQTFVSEGRAG